ncbi:AMIN domain-containing protein [Anabaena cylindrica UHCC 0172]|uniref:AMIN domain-containing protein n=1 Tax=Anabaena cylindrica TaxID=1165 RepID=UPI002B2005F9|nr:AMIN domain-containing protein [Anabaena cylindrica]MEA5552317.1 AMIN domain-containing protein [Anabaena cylindrica UHCC 0172]
MKNQLRTPPHIFQISLFGLSAAIILNTTISLAAPLAKLNQWQFNPKTQQLEITLSSTTIPEYFYLPQPPRLVVDLPNTQLGNIDTQKNYTGGKIQKIRVSQFSSNITRIVIDLEPGSFVDVNQIKLQPNSSNNPTRWVLSPTISHNSTSSQSPFSFSPTNQLSPAPLNTLPPPSTNLPLNQQPFVIVPPPNSQQSNFIILPANSSENNNIITVPNSLPNTPNPENYLDQVPNFPIIEFGQPLPIQK